MRGFVRSLGWIRLDLESQVPHTFQMSIDEALTVFFALVKDALITHLFRFRTSTAGLQRFAVLSNR